MIRILPGERIREMHERTTRAYSANWLLPGLSIVFANSWPDRSCRLKPGCSPGGRVRRNGPTGVGMDLGLEFVLTLLF